MPYCIFHSFCIVFSGYVLAFREFGVHQYFMNEHFAHVPSQGDPTRSSYYTALCRKHVTFDADRYPIMLGIKINYKSIYRFVEAGALL